MDGTLIRILTAIATLSFLCGLWLVITRKSVKQKRHLRNIKTAGRVIDTISAFDGDGANARIIAYLRKISPYVFEELLLNAFEHKGYRIVRNSGYSNDGGIDGKMYNRSGGLVLLQAKRYGGPVKRSHVQEFRLKIESLGAVGGYFIHTVRTPRGTALRDGPVAILSGDRLVKLVKMGTDG